MVEGPGCKVKGQNLLRRVRGQTVKNVGGNALEKKIPRKASGDDSPFHRFIGRKLDDIQTLGKELFMFFGEIALRFHFLMNGSYRLNNENEAGDRSDKSGKKPSFVLYMEKDSIMFYDSAVEERMSADCHTKIEALRDLDICSSTFNHKRAVAIATDQRSRLACDVLLDQEILPGVGNIIKNEALFDSGIRPDSKMEILTEQHVSHLIKMTRDFSMIFYKCRKENKPLYPYMKIYKKEKCGQCAGKVIVCCMGEDSPRMTYFCAGCQTNDLNKVKQRNLPTKNSLLGWISGGSQLNNQQKSSQENWACSVCTLINKYSRTCCSACLTPRNPVSHHHNQTHTASPLSGSEVIAQGSKVIPQTNLNVKSLGNMVKEVTKKDDLNPNMPKRTFTFKTMSPHSSNTLPIKRPCMNITGGERTNNSFTDTVSNLSSPVTSKSKPENRVTQNQEGNVTKQQVVPSWGNQENQGLKNTDVKSKIPLCDKHHIPCVMKEVRKKGPNERRMFFSCPKGRQCNFFKWADEDFPICETHGKKCALRTVLKLGPNNGRKFFACCLPKNKQCQFFQWAEGY